VEPPMLVNIPLLDDLLDRHAEVLGGDFDAYRNHAYRVVNFYRLLDKNEFEDVDKVAIAAVFHDIGIWTAGTFDYLPPSIAAASEYLREIDRESWHQEIAAMIDHHHKLTECAVALPHSVELFRRADWIDVSMGWVRFGLPRCIVAPVRAMFPGYGFHRLLTKLVLRRAARHPLSPLPMLRW
jgi:hypothetical protein